MAGYDGAFSLLLTLVAFCTNLSMHESNLAEDEDMPVQDRPEPREFCSHEIFNATCRPNEVLMIQSANYGRLRLGRCVKIGLGFLGCKANVRHIVEMRCTGRRHCSLPVADLELRMTSPCPTDVTWHLEVSYVCQKVLSREDSLCRADLRLSSHSPSSLSSSSSSSYSSSASASSASSYSGFIASIVSTESQYGRDRCPWTLWVRPGQQVLLRLVAFQSPTIRDPKFSNACVEIGAVQDAGRRSPLVLCGWDQATAAPRRRLYLSETNHIALSLSLLGSTDYYVIHYTAVGCPVFPLPVRSWSQRVGDKLIVRCNESEEMWSIVCRQTDWIGSAGNCSSFGRTVEWKQDTTAAAETGVPMSILVAVAVGVALGIFIGGILLALVATKINQRRKSRLHDGSQVTTELMTSDAQKPSLLFRSDRYSIEPGSKVSDYAMRWICPSQLESMSSDPGGGGGGGSGGGGLGESGVAVDGGSEQALTICEAHRHCSSSSSTYSPAAPGANSTSVCSSLLDFRQNYHQSLLHHHLHHHHLYDTTTIT